MNRIYEATRDITRSLDEIVWAANPTHDTLESFAEYLASNAQRFLQAANIRCRLDFPLQLPSQTVPSQVRHHLFLSCREAINNVVKHAHATSVLIQRTWFKITKRIHGEGRRVFLMSPLHHHFELKGWKENTVIVRFWILAGLFTALALGFYYADFLRIGVVD